MLKKGLILIFILGLSSQIFAHCGSCGTGGSKDEAKDWGEKKLQQKVRLIKAFGLSSADEEALISLEKKMMADLKEIKDTYQAKVAGFLNQDQQAVYLMTPKAKKGCCTSKGGR
ncbi:MAG: hypothetical protein VW378_04570 [bacterium]